MRLFGSPDSDEEKKDIDKVDTRYGAAKVGVFATGFVLLGQIIVCFSQDDGHFHPISITGTVSHSLSCLENFT